MPKYLVTHGDLDGAGAAVIAETIYKISFTFFADYTTIDSYLFNFISSKKDEKDVELLIADICPSQSVCEELNKVSENFKVKLFDHHKTRQWATQYPWATFDPMKSGTKLLHEYVSTTATEGWRHVLSHYLDFVEAVDAWDLWKLDSPHRARGEQLNALFKFLRTQEFIPLFVKNPEADKEEPIKTLLEYLEKEKQHIIKRAISTCEKSPIVRRDSLGHMYMIIFTTDYVSEVCHAILNHPDFNDLHFILAYSPLAETCSLRAKGAIDVSEIAKKLGGGGHKDAAGFHYPVRAHIEENIFKLIAQIEY